VFQPVSTASAGVTMIGVAVTIKITSIKRTVDIFFIFSPSVKKSNHFDFDKYIANIYANFKTPFENSKVGYISGRFQQAVGVP